MPTIATQKGFRFFFYSNEGDEPPHVHVQSGNKVAKFWLSPISVAYRDRFTDHELGEASRIAIRDHDEFLREWYEFFNVSE